MLLHNRFPNVIAFYWNDLWERKLTFIIWRHCFKWTVSSCRILGSQNWPKTKRKKRKNFFICNEKCWLTDRVSPCFEKRYRTTHWHTIKLKKKKSINCYTYPQRLFFHLNLFNCMFLSFCFFCYWKLFCWLRIFCLNARMVINLL